jgi:hypothetical protein
MVLVDIDGSNTHHPPAYFIRKLLFANVRVWVVHSLWLRFMRIT